MNKLYKLVLNRINDDILFSYTADSVVVSVDSNLLELKDFEDITIADFHEILDLRGLEVVATKTFSVLKDVDEVEERTLDLIYKVIDVEMVDFISHTDFELYITVSALQ